MMHRFAAQGRRLAASLLSIRAKGRPHALRVGSELADAGARLRAAADRAADVWGAMGKGISPRPLEQARRGGAAPAEPSWRSQASRGGEVERSDLADEDRRGLGGVADGGAAEGLAAQIAARASLAKIGGRDIFDKCYRFTTADDARKMGIYPFFRALEASHGPQIRLEGRTVTMLGSNNYLGLTMHPKVRKEAIRAIERYGTSLTGSRLMNGTTRMHEELEAELAAFHGKEAALVFTTGYHVALALLSALLSNKAAVAVVDKEVHASIYDGVRLGVAAMARMVRFRHNDADALERVLTALDGSEGAIVLTEGVFGVQGEIADLRRVVEVTRRHGARLFVDDAHGLGVLGPEGRGTPAHLGVADGVDLIGGTFSKSLASSGGWLVGERKVLDYVRHFASSFLFAASAPPASVAAALAALRVMQEEPWRRERLRDNFTYFKRELVRLGFDVGQTETAVVPIFVRDDMKAMLMGKALLEEHAVFVNVFITPGVAPRQQALRTSVMATHERHHLDQALEALAEVGRRFGVI